MFQKDARRLWVVALLLAVPMAAQDARSTLHLTAPITRWDEAVPIGNGLLGGLLWGEGSTLNLSLDRGDLWDERLPEIFRTPIWNWTTMQRLVAQDSMPRFHALFDDPYEQIPYPTKLPGGRLVLTRSIGGAVREFQLRLHEAEALALFDTDSVSAVALADRPVLLLRVPGSVRLTIVPPAGVAKLGYPAAVVDANGFTQRGADGFRYSAQARTRLVEGATLVAVTIATTRDGADPKAIAGERLDAVLREGWNANLQRHRRWWGAHWAISGVTLPDSALQQHYDLVHYFYGAAARRGAPPMPLQGVWTADAGGLPPWKGDFHNDLNTQMTYLAAHAAGLDDAMLGWLDFLEARLPVFRRFAQEFYDAPGAVIPGVMTLAGEPMAGWGMYSLSPTNGAWVAQSFYLHWRSSGDRVFLETRVYPFMQEIATALGALLKPGADGRWRLPLSSSPEIHDNSRRAFLTPNSSYDQALLYALFHELEEMADTLGRNVDARKWNQLQAQLGPLVPEGLTGSLPFAAGEEYTASHRHFSHAMAIHPLGLLDPRGADSAVVRATVDTIAKYGTQQWTGYSFAWFSAMLARTGRGDEALRYLTDYLAFTLRNGFHANGDQSGRGLSAMTYRPFTLEGNFLAMHAVHEMLLQAQGGTVVVFPATPAVWRDVAFRDLRADGGWRVSAWRRGGVVDSVRIVAGPGGVLRLRDPFGGAAVRWSRGGVQREGDSWVAELGGGVVLVGRRVGS
jgi:alpha-L-fucosidase 2